MTDKKMAAFVHCETCGVPVWFAKKVAAHRRCKECRSGRKARQRERDRRNRRGITEEIDMSLLTDFWAKFTFDVNDPPAPSQEEATDLLQVDAPTLTDAEGDAWFVAVATAYEGLGVINQPTYVQLRNEINNSGEATSNDLFDALQARILPLPETVVVTDALQTQAFVVELASIPGSVAIVEGNKAATTDETLRTAYDQAIAALLLRQQELQTILGT